MHCARKIIFSYSVYTKYKYKSAKENIVTVANSSMSMQRCVVFTLEWTGLCNDLPHKETFTLLVTAALLTGLE